MEQIKVTTERGIETTTTLKNGDILLEVCPPELQEEQIAATQAYYINNEEVDRSVYEKRLQNA